MAETKTAAKKPAAKKTANKATGQKLTKMVRDDGKEAMVHPSMIDAYKSGGFKEA